MNNKKRVKNYKKYKLLPFFYPKRLIILAFIVFIIIPSLIWNSIMGNFLIFFIPQFSIFIVIIILSFIISKISILKNLAFYPLSGLVALYYLFLYFLLSYVYYRGVVFDFYFALDAFKDIATNTINTIGLNSFIILLILFLILLIIFYILALKLIKQFTELKSRAFLIFMLPVLIMGILLWSYQCSYSDKCTFIYTQDFTEIAAARSIIHPIFPDYKEFKTSSEENIFILQLESGNGRVLLNNLTLSKRQYNIPHLPNIEKLSQEGILFPLFWGNTIQTNRAQETILCGIANNIGKPFAYNPSGLESSCLPEILNKTGYTTIFMAADNLLFSNTGNFMKHIGFNEVHGEDIMNPDSKRDTWLKQKGSWGYDDCEFYDRAFDYLRKKHENPSRLFIYFVVESSHYGFEPKEQYSFTKEFKNPSNFIEKYYNSKREEDYCLSKFTKNIENYAGNNTHVLILPDHSWPIGIHENNTFNEKNAFNENFLTYLLYIPPKAKKHLFSIGSRVNEIYAQTDIIPTIFELLNEKSYSNSFAPTLKSSPLLEYDACHILIQPYDGGQIAIIKGDDKYLYKISQQQLLFYNIKEDIDENHPLILAENLSYQDFYSQYYCRRYKTNK